MTWRFDDDSIERVFEGGSSNPPSITDTRDGLSSGNNNERQGESSDFQSCIFVHQNLAIQIGETFATPHTHSESERINIDAPNDDALEAITADTLSIPIVIPTTLSFLKFCFLVDIDGTVEQR